MKYILYLLFIINLINYGIENGGTGCGGKFKASKLKMAKILLVIESFEMDCPNLQINENDVIEILSFNDYKDNCFDGPYLTKKDIFDNYNQQYRYFTFNGQHLIVSLGKDGILGTKDDKSILDKRYNNKIKRKT